MNQNVDNACKLADNDRWGAIFHPKNIKDLVLPKINGTDLCLKFHINGRCHSKCARRSTHIPLNNNNLIGLRTYVKKAKENYETFLANRMSKLNLDKTSSKQNDSNNNKEPADTGKDIP